MESQIPEYDFSIPMNPVAKLFQRGHHALIFMRTVDGHFLLGSKRVYYPVNICRMVGGGIDAGEDPQQGALRELQEETGLVVPLDRLQKLATITLTIPSEKDTYTFITHVFFIQVTAEEELRMRGGDDVDEIKKFSKEELEQLIKRFRSLPTDVTDLEGDGSGPFRWSDYGKFYAEVHAIALELSNSFFGVKKVREMKGVVPSDHYVTDGEMHEAILKRMKEKYSDS